MQKCCLSDKEDRSIWGSLKTSQRNSNIDNLSQQSKSRQGRVIIVSLSFKLLGKTRYLSAWWMLRLQTMRAMLLLQTLSVHVLCFCIFQVTRTSQSIWQSITITLYMFWVAVPVSTKCETACKDFAHFYLILILTIKYYSWDKRLFFASQSNASWLSHTELQCMADWNEGITYNNVKKLWQSNNEKYVWYKLVTCRVRQ